MTRRTSVSSWSPALTGENQQHHLPQRASMAVISGGFNWSQSAFLQDAPAPRNSSGEALVRSLAVIWSLDLQHQTMAAASRLSKHL